MLLVSYPESKILTSVAWSSHLILRFSGFVCVHQYHHCWKPKWLLMFHFFSTLKSDLTQNIIILKNWKEEAKLTKHQGRIFYFIFYMRVLFLIFRLCEMFDVEVSPPKYEAIMAHAKCFCNEMFGHPLISGPIILFWWEGNNPEIIK